MRAFERLHPADGFAFRIRSEIPLSGGLGSSAAAIVAGLMAADHLFELDADLLTLASELEGHPDNVAAALNGGFVICADGEAVRFEAPTGLEALAVIPSEAVRTRAARAALDAQVPLAEAVFNVAHGALLTLGLARGDWDLVARGLQDRLHQQRRAQLFPRSYELALRARELGALGATISGAGPTVLCGASTSRPAPSWRCCRGRSRVGRRCCGLRSSRRGRTWGGYKGAQGSDGGWSSEMWCEREPQHLGGVAHRGVVEAQRTYVDCREVLRGAVEERDVDEAGLER